MTKKVATAKEVELNCWCIEMAMRWPVVTSYGNGNQLGAAYQQGLQQNVRQDCDADVIGRATKIHSWVKTAR